MTEARGPTGHILIVEDDRDLRTSLCDALVLEGFHVATAEDGVAALRHLESGARPCLILLDLMMPVMDGRSFREHQLQIPALAQIPVVVFSAYQDVAQRASDMNVAGHLVKPLKLPDLLRTIQQYCSGPGAS